MRTWLQALVAPAILVCLSAAVLAAEPVSDLLGGETGKLLFTAKTPTSYSGLAKGQLQAQTISGDLLLPSNITGRVPAVVIAHGSGGVSDKDYEWAKLFLAQGWAAFVVDSFTQRNIGKTRDNQGQLSYAVGIADSLSALQLLATHPRVDSKRIAVTGFSRGGSAALYAVHDIFRKAVILSDLKFAAHVALYPGCLVWSEKQTGAPVRIYMGDQDDYQTPETCGRYVELMRSRGTDALLTVYPGAKHGFDNSSTSVSVAPRAEQWRDCGHRYNIDNQTFWRPDTSETRPASEIAAYEASCKRLGASFGGNRKAREGAMSASVAFLIEVFR